MAVATKSETQAMHASSKRTGSFRKFLLTSMIVMTLLPANGFSSDDTGGKSNRQDECHQLAVKSKAAAGRCSQGHQPACEEYQKLIAERVEKCVSDDGQGAPKPQQKPKKKAPK